MNSIVKTSVGDYDLLNLLQQVKKDIFLLLGDSVKELKLYGSYARHDYNTDSNVNIFLLYDETVVKNIDDLVSEISVEYQIKFGIMININYMSITYYNKYKNILPLIKNIEKEGIVI